MGKGVSNMSEYKVTWTIDLDAKSPRDAARKALEIQRDPDSTATCFEVAYHKVTRGKHKSKSKYVRDSIDLLGDQK
jgi:hypothetical protein